MRILDAAAAGISRGIETLNGAAARIAKADGPGDLVADTVTLRSAEVQVRANVTVARAEQEMQKSLVDLMA
mgnify:CR=1 FL=1